MDALMATPNSRTEPHVRTVIRSINKCQKRRGTRSVGQISIAAILLTLCYGINARAEVSDWTNHSERVFQEARANYSDGAQSVEKGWKLGKACFDRAEFATNDAQRASLAEEGIKACQNAIAHKYGSAEAHYYLAMNSGQLARTKTVGALRLVREMETEFKTAIDLDAKVNYAGPHRSLGLLYKNAPGWPTSIGSRSKARFHLRRATELCPDFPENVITLAEANLDWGETKTVVDGLPSLMKTIEKARSQFQGDDWSFEWHDWETRMEAIRERLGTAIKPTVSPRGHGK